MVNIRLITPAKPGSKNGNRTSAQRWARLLRGQGHRVRIATDYSGESAELMIALHAWRSAEAITRYRQRYPLGPLIVALGGTDINTFLTTEPAVTLRSMALANALVCLHDRAGEELPKRLRDKLYVIRQSARPGLPRRPETRVRGFPICVVGHLREEKDPLRAALAARLLPPESRLQVIHFGKAHDASWSAQARQEMARNPRYLWRGEVPGWRVRREFSRTRLMVISSYQEGGANVVSEAVAAGVPVIASEISGNIGLLGARYPGYYPAGDERALAALLARAETEPRFLRRLTLRGQKLQPLFTPAREAAGWAEVIARVTGLT